MVSSDVMNLTALLLTREQTAPDTAGTVKERQANDAIIKTIFLLRHNHIDKPIGWI